MNLSRRRRNKSDGRWPHLNLFISLTLLMFTDDSFSIIKSSFAFVPTAQQQHNSNTRSSCRRSLQRQEKSTDNNKNNNNDNSELVDSLRNAAKQVGSDLFVAFRWGAANALTSALPDEQRKELLGRLDPEDPEKQKNGKGVVDEELMTNSVNEAVAAALAEESQKEKKRWDQEKETILAQAQDAAEQRVENEIAIQKQRLEQEKRKVEQAAAEKLKKLEKEKEEREAWFMQELEAQAKAEQKEKDLQDKSIAWKSASEDEEHPILGPVVANLGYKRIHLVSAATLGTIPVWKRQRVYRHDRAKVMATDKMKTQHLGLPGIICIHEEDNGKLSILDGQHRVGMMKILGDKLKGETEKENGLASDQASIDLDKILVEVYPQNSQVRSNDYAQDIFMEINKAEPIKLVDMPGVASAKDRKLISQAVQRLEGQFPKMFSPSQRCRVPHVNVDNLRDSIFASNIIKRNNMKSTKDLLEWMLSQNKVVEDKYKSSKDLQKSVNDKAWGKAKSNKFYLGLDSSWLYN